MKKKMTLKKKLELHRETLRALEEQNLNTIAGGLSTLACTISRCDGTCPNC